MAAVHDHPDIQGSILAQTLGSLDGHAEFPEELLAILTHLAESGEIKRPQRLLSALQASYGSENEAN